MSVSDAAQGTQARWLPGLAVLVVLCVAVYGRVGGFDYSRTDDFGYVLLNGHVRNGLSLDGLLWAFGALEMGNWHPLAWVSHMADMSLFGFAPGPRHVVNVLLHLLNSVLLWRLALRLLRDADAALLVGALFLVHALHVESVAWIAERKDVLCGAFFLLACNAHLDYVDNRSRGAWLRVQCFGVLALLSKPMAVTLPLVLLMLDVWPSLQLPQRCGERSGRARVIAALITEKLPLFIVSLAVAVMTVLAQDGAIAPLAQVSVGERLSNVPVALAMYLSDLALPTGLASFYPFRLPDPLREVLPSLLLLVGITVACWRLRGRWPWLLWGWGWFLLVIAPVSGIVQAGSQSHADRYMYLPSVGLLLWIGAALAACHARYRRRLLAAGVVLVVFHALLGWIQVGYWRDPAMIYGRVLDVSGEHYTVSIGLSAYLLEHGAPEDARRHAFRAIELAPEQPAVHANLGFLALQAGDWALAERAYRRATELAPLDATAINNLGLALEKQGRIPEARAAFLRALELDSAMPGFRKNLDRVNGQR
jgi:hypothetical protein